MFTLQGLIITALIGLAAGWLANQFMGEGSYGIVGDMILGIIGASVGSFVASLLSLTFGGLLGAIVVATIGAMLVIFILRRVKFR